MTDALTDPVESLSSWWKVAALGTMAAGFAVLILLTVKAYENAPPIPGKLVNPAGNVVFTADDIVAGQQVFLKHGLMDNGTIWGHGGYLGPDFSAQSLHILALDLADRIARERLSRGYAELTPEERAAVEGAVALTLKANHYDPANGRLALPPGAAESFNGQVEYWTRYFGGPERNGGLARDTVSDPRELRQLSAFFAWTAWASAATRPGTSHSYTNNFPYEPLAGNTPTGSALNLQRAQSRIPTWRDSGRASRLREIRLSRLAPPRGDSHTRCGSAAERRAARDPKIYGYRRSDVLRSGL